MGGIRLGSEGIFEEEANPDDTKAGMELLMILAVLKAGIELLRRCRPCLRLISLLPFLSFPFRGVTGVEAASKPPEEHAS